MATMAFVETKGQPQPRHQRQLLLQQHPRNKSHHSGRPPKSAIGLASHTRYRPEGVTQIGAEKRAPTAGQQRPTLAMSAVNIIQQWRQ